MRRVLTGAAVIASLAMASAGWSAPKPDKSLLGIRVLDTWKSVLTKFGQPTRVEAGPPAEISVSPTSAMLGTGASASLPGMGGMAGLRGMTGGTSMPLMGGISGPPTTPMMGGMGALSSAGGVSAPRGPMVGGMSAPGYSAGGGGMLMGPPPGAMGGMSTAGAGGMGSSMMRPPTGGMAGMSSAGGRGLPGLGGMGMSAPMGGMSAPMGGMGAPAGLSIPGPGGIPMPGMPGGMMGAPTLGGMPGGPMTGMTGGTGAQVSGGAAIETGPGEVAWIYEKGTTTHVFLFNNEGRVIQIQSFGYSAGARTVNGVGLGDTAAKIYSIYGFPEETIVSGNTRTLVYSEKANVAFQLAQREGKGLRVVGITVGLTKVPNPEKPE